MPRRNNVSIAIMAHAYGIQALPLNVLATQVDAASGVDYCLVTVASMCRRSRRMRLEAHRPVRSPSFCAAAPILTFHNRLEAPFIHLREPLGTARRTEPSDRIVVSGVLLCAGLSVGARAL